MVIAVNGWMNHPAASGFVDGKVVDVHPWRALFGNTYLWHELVHMYLAGYIVSGLRRRRPSTPWGGCAGAGAATSGPRSRSR